MNLLRHYTKNNGATDYDQGSGILLACQGYVLLVKRSQQVLDPNVWSIPGGGRCQVGPRGRLENPWLSAVRELQEEVGSLPFPLTPTRKFTWKKPPKTYITYLVVLPPQALLWTPNLNWENTAWRWVDVITLSLLKLHPGLKWVLSQLGRDKFAVPHHRPKTSD